MNGGRSAHRGAVVGLASGAIVVSAMFALRLAFGVQALPDIAADAMTLILPGGLFGYLIDRLQELGRPLLLVGVASGLLVLSCAVGAVAARFLGGRGLAVRVAVPALTLSAATLPFVLIGLDNDLAVAPATATAAYWLLYALLLEEGLASGASRRLVPSAPVDLSRRALLYGAGVLGSAWLAAYLGSRLGAAAQKREPRQVLPVTREPSATPLPVTPAASDAPGPTEPPEPFPDLTGITTTKDFYVISKNAVEDPTVDASRWRLQVGGLRPYGLTYDELLRLPARERPRTLECISNNVGGPLISTAVFRGVPLRDLLERAGLPTGTREIRFTCADGYTESIDLETTNDPDTIVAYLMNGEPLTKEHGFPTRLLMSGRYGMKDPKWLTAIAPLSQPYNGYWEQRGWSKEAIVLTKSRQDFPEEHDRVPAGRPFPFRGVAYAGARGISKVEISFDGGRTWRETRLRRILPKDNWTPFTFVWTPPAPGTYDVRVRATDGEGQLQDATERDSFPNGSTGIHRVNIKVG